MLIYFQSTYSSTLACSVSQIIFFSLGFDNEKKWKKRARLKNKQTPQGLLFRLQK